MRRIGIIATITPAVLALAISPALASPNPRPVFSGLAYGSTVDLAGVASSGKTAVAGLCNTSPTSSSTNNAAAVNIPGVGDIGAVTTSITASQSGSSSTSTAQAHTATTNLLGGMITADAIDATSTMTYTGTGYHHTGTVNLVNLNINGQSIPASPPANTVVSIPSVATITINGQSGNANGFLRSWTTTALKIVILPGNPLGAAAGTIVISNATATLHAPVNRLASGGAYGTTVTVGGVVTSGRTAVTAIACGGTDGRTISNSTVGLNLPGVVTSGTISSTSMSTDSPSSTNATTQAQTEDLNVAAGLIHADAIIATAVATRANQATTYTGTSASFVNLVIGGVAFPSTVPENTVVPLGPLGSLGSVTLNAVIIDGHGAQAYGLLVTLTGGTKIVVSSAHAQVTHN